MKFNFKSLIVSCAILWTSFALAQENKTSDKPELLFILGGQSNMAGNGFLADLPNTSEYQSYLIAPSNVSIWNSTSNAWKPIKPGMKFGPEIGFAHALSKAFPNKHIGLVKYVVGGTSMDKWHPKGKLYTQLLDDFAKAKATVPNAVLGAMLWHQGESDCDTEEDAKAYKKKFVQLIETVRLDTQAPNLPFIYAQINPAKSFCGRPRFAYTDIVRESQAELQLLNTFMIATGDLDMNEYIDGNARTPKEKRIPKYEDNIHLSATGQIELGKRFAECFYNCGNK